MANKFDNFILGYATYKSFLNARVLMLIAIGVSSLIRAVFFFQIYPNIDVISAQDQRIYIRLGEVLLSNWDFGAEFGPERMPLYPLFLAVCKTIYDNLFFALVVQNILGLFSIIISYKIGALFSRKLAILCVFFAAINSNFIVESNLVLTESLFYPMFALFYFFLFRYVKKKQNSDILLAGLVLGICTLIRPVAMLLPFFIIIYLIFQPNMLLLNKAKQVLLFICLFFLVLSPWLYRNHAVYNAVGLTTQGASHMAGWVIPYVMQYEDNIDLAAAKKKSMNLWKKKLETLPDKYKDNPFEMDKKAKKFGMSYLMNASPFSVARAWFWGATKNIFSPVTVELSFLLDMDRTLFGESKGANVPEQLFNFIFKNRNKVYSVLMISGILGILLFRFLQLIGVWRASSNNKEVLFVCFLVAAYFLIISGPVGYAKYRIPLEQILILFTAFSFEKKKAEIL